jgi:predicted nucleic acid-binding protein
VAEQSFALRRQRKIKLPDAIIEATARVNDRILMTRNTRDFPAEESGISIPYVL